MVPLAPLLIILGSAFVYELGRRALSGPASVGLASAVILAAGIPALYLSLRISAPAQEDPRRIISDLDFDNPTRTAFDRYTRYVGPLGITGAHPATADIFVTSSFTYDRFGAISTPHGQSRRTRERLSFYAALFNMPYLDVTNGRPPYAYFNPIIRIVALDGDAGATCAHCGGSYAGQRQVLASASSTHRLNWRERTSRRRHRGPLSAKADNTRMSRSVHGVLVDPAVFHDEIEILGGVADEIEMLQRIAVDQDQVGQRAFLDHAELAGIGITQAR